MKSPTNPSRLPTGTHLPLSVLLAANPVIAGAAMQVVGLGVPFILGGGLKIVYDLLLSAMFRSVRPPEER